jgi:CBS domain-containing protein
MRTVADLLAHKGHDVHTIDEHATTCDAARLMLNHGVGSLVVTQGGAAVGIITRNDLVQAIAERRGSLDGCRVFELMTAPAQTTHGGADLRGIRDRMVSHGIRHMPVANGTRVVGLITLADVLYLELHDANVMNRNLEEYMYGPYF